MKPINTKDLTATLNLSECRDGWWLYDSTRGMNLAMRSQTPEAAFVEALGYYQNRLNTMETQLAALYAVISGFTSKLQGVDPALIPDINSDY